MVLFAVVERLRTVTPEIRVRLSYSTLRERLTMNNWTFKHKKISSKYGRTVPERVEARRRVGGVDILLVAFDGGLTTISMNGTAPLNSFDLLDMSDAMSHATDALHKGLYKGV